MTNFCPSCQAPLGGTDANCPSCGAVPSAAATAYADPPGRVATGTVVGFGAVRQVRIVSRGIVVSGRIAVLTASCAFVGVLVTRGVLGTEALVTVAGLVILLILGSGLRLTISAVGRSSVTSGRSPTALWPWTLPMRNLDAHRTVDVLPLLIRDITGREHRCAVRGRLVPAMPQQGDVVEVYGRRDPSGTVRVRQLVTVATGSTARSKLPVVCRLTRTIALAVPAVWTVMALISLWLLTFGQ